nr:hypothetical protein [Candidatus Woesearchaeota archaeon]
MGQQKEHKKCVQGVHNRLKSTHQCFKEFPIFREGNVHFIDTVGFPHKDRPYLKPIAVECECGSSKPQQESNRSDLTEFKKRYPEAEVFQVNKAEEIDYDKLKRFKRTMSIPRITN